MPLVKYVAEILGYLMNGIYLLLDKAGIPNVALAIILFTIVMYLLMTMQSTVLIRRVPVFSS